MFVFRTEKKIILKSQYKKTKEVNKYYQKWSATPSAPRGQFAFIWTDYDNYLVGHQCHENDASGDHGLDFKIDFKFVFILF